LQVLAPIAHVCIDYLNSVMCAPIPGIDFKQKIINLDGTAIKLQIW